MLLRSGADLGHHDDDDIAAIASGLGQAVRLGDLVEGRVPAQDSLGAKPQVVRSMYQLEFSLQNLTR